MDRAPTSGGAMRVPTREEVTAAIVTVRSRQQVLRRERRAFLKSMRQSLELSRGIRGVSLDQMYGVLALGVAALPLATGCCLAVAAVAGFGAMAGFAWFAPRLRL
eukprot:TRINITY_DN75982_c0_g1_i1.p2 TRINITY_DN75982_c0_g1~~TRINITY_DN75982_c0_g1_i1.p2  ORF type:complete len:105 (-),score=0.50 TRINITY_DN75982_c0_g1_i1:189-503(-)